MQASGRDGTSPVRYASILSSNRLRLGPVEEIGPGDVVTLGPNEKRWHGASPTTAMTHLAIRESLDGKAVGGLKKLADAQYHGKR